MIVRGSVTRDTIGFGKMLNPSCEEAYWTAALFVRHNEPLRNYRVRHIFRNYWYHNELARAVHARRVLD
jgi:hypothetical protein